MLMESHRRSRSTEVGLGPTKYILGVDFVQCGFYQYTTLQKSGVTPCWLMQGSMVCQIWGGFIYITSVRACPNVETNTEGFPYSGNCSKLYGVDVYLRL